MRVVAFGTYDKHTHPRIAVLLEGLRVHGVDVDECNAPLGLGTSDRVHMLHRPWLVPALGTRLLTRWLRLANDLRGMLPADVVLVGYLGHFDVVLARLLRRRRYRIVLDHLVSAHDTAVDRGARNPVVLWCLRMLDRIAVSCADVVVVDTEESGQLVPARFRDRVVVAAVGAEEQWRNARRPAPAGDGPLRVVFFGTFTPLQGAVVVADASRLLPPDSVDLTLIGGGQDEPEVRRRAAPGVRWQSWLEPDQLAMDVAEHDVCLGIFGTSGKAGRVVPNKVFQGAAAGCAVVTSDTPPQRRALENAATFVPAGDAAALASALTDLAADRGRVTSARAAAAARADEAFTPAAVVAPLLAVLHRRHSEPDTRPRDERSACSLP